METIELIKNYITFLITECALEVTLHPWEKEELITLSDLALFNIHHNPYCTLIKTADGGQQCCIAQQKKVFARCQDGAFCGTCHAGVFEYVYPITDGKTVFGFISVGGYKGKDKYIEKTSERFGIKKEVLESAYATLKTPPSKKRIDTLVLPLCNMLTLAYITSAEKTERESRCIDKILQYIRQHYDTNITIDLLCEKFSCSRSYVSHSFKSVAGKSFKQYLTDLRIRHAKRLLEITSQSVTEIAFSVGFNDSNYFSTAFVNIVGISPLAYRKQKRKSK